MRRRRLDYYFKSPGVVVMIICSCNVFSDGDVRTLIATRSHAVGTVQVYRHLGHEPQCGRCARTIRKIIDEAGPAAGDQH